MSSKCINRVFTLGNFQVNQEIKSMSVKKFYDSEKSAIYVFLKVFFLVFDRYVIGHIPRIHIGCRITKENKIYHPKMEEKASNFYSG
jgi:hypothetical protein